MDRSSLHCRLTGLQHGCVHEKDSQEHPQNPLARCPSRQELIDRFPSPGGHLACIHIDRSGQSKSWPKMQARTFTAAHLDPDRLETSLSKSQSGERKASQRYGKGKYEKSIAWTGQPVAYQAQRVLSLSSPPSPTPESGHEIQQHSCRLGLATNDAPNVFLSS